MPYTGEDTLHLARRHVAEGERRVAEQAARVEHLVSKGYDAEEAQKLLDNMEDALRSMREHLEYEERLAGKR